MPATILSQPRQQDAFAAAASFRRSGHCRVSSPVMLSSDCCFDFAIFLLLLLAAIAAPQ